MDPLDERQVERGIGRAQQRSAVVCLKRRSSARRWDCACRQQRTRRMRVRGSPAAPTQHSSGGHVR